MLTIFKFKNYFKSICASVAMKLSRNYQPPCLSNLRTVGPSILQLSIG